MTSEDTTTGGVYRSARRLLLELPTLMLSVVDLLSTELRLLRLQALRVALLFLMAGVTMVVAWIALCSALAHGLVLLLDWPLPFPWLLIVALNAVLLIFILRRLDISVSALGLPASTRQLRETFAPAGTPTNPDDPATQPSPHEERGQA